MSESRLVVPARYDRIKQVCDFVEAAADGAGLDETSKFHCQMAVDEACTNIIEHGYEGEDRGQIEAVCSAAPGVLRIELRDQARPFDINKVPEPRLNVPLEESTVGGLGVHFIKKMMDEVTFSREMGTNRLVMVKRKSGALTPL
ncbi:MAG: ATP-binding protein [Chloroflexota bacterium]